MALIEPGAAPHALRGLSLIFEQYKISREKCIGNHMNSSAILVWRLLAQESGITLLW